MGFLLPIQPCFIILVLLFHSEFFLWIRIIIRELSLQHVIVTIAFFIKKKKKRIQQKQPIRCQLHAIFAIVVIKTLLLENIPVQLDIEMIKGDLVCCCMLHFDVFFAFVC